MNIKSCLLSAVIALGVGSTPAAAATVMLMSPFNSTYQITGPEGLDFFSLDCSVSLSTPMPVLDLPVGDHSAWEYIVDLATFTDGIRGIGGVIGSGCFFNAVQCFREPITHGITGRVGDVIRLNYIIIISGAFPGPAPQAQVSINLPDGVSISSSPGPLTISNTPIPASWLLFSSILGLAALFHRWRAQTYP